MQVLNHQMSERSCSQGAAAAVAEGAGLPPGEGDSTNGKRVPRIPGGATRSLAKSFMALVGMWSIKPIPKTLRTEVRGYNPTIIDCQKCQRFSWLDSCRVPGLVLFG